MWISQVHIGQMSAVHDIGFNGEIFSTLFPYTWFGLALKVYWNEHENLRIAQATPPSKPWSLQMCLCTVLNPVNMSSEFIYVLIVFSLIFFLFGHIQINDFKILELIVFLLIIFKNNVMYKISIINNCVYF